MTVCFFSSLCTDGGDFSFHSIKQNKPYIRVVGRLFNEEGEHGVHRSSRGVPAY